MVLCVRRLNILFYVLLVLTGLAGGAPAASAQTADAEPEAAANVVAALPPTTLPLPAQKPLPPRDGLSCSGPPACAPCFATHRGFLYYNTYPWDDDPVNGFNDCPSGECGSACAMLSLAWIRHHQKSIYRKKPPHQLSLGCPSCNAAPHYFPITDSDGLFQITGSEGVDQ